MAAWHVSNGNATNILTLQVGAARLFEKDVSKT